jgi:hypothetical protein
VDEATLAELRHLSAQTVEVTFARPVPELGQLAGIAVECAGAKALRFEVRGSVRPLLDALAGEAVSGLTSSEPSLEEIYLHHYGPVDGVAVYPSHRCRRHLHAHQLRLCLGAFRCSAQCSLIAPRGLAVRANPARPRTADPALVTVAAGLLAAVAAGFVFRRRDLIPA